MARKNDREYYVLEERKGDGCTTYQVAAGHGVSDRASCEKWIRTCGAPEVPYHVVVFVGEPIFVHVEQAEKRTLAPAAAPDPEPQEPAE